MRTAQTLPPKGTPKIAPAAPSGAGPALAQEPRAGPYPQVGRLRGLPGWAGARLPGVAGLAEQRTVPIPCGGSSASPCFPGERSARRLRLPPGMEGGGAGLDSPKQGWSPSTAGGRGAPRGAGAGTAVLSVSGSAREAPPSRGSPGTRERLSRPACPVRSSGFLGCFAADVCPPWPRVK